MPAPACDFDVLIAGGGMIGMSAALALSSLPLRIAMVEAVPREAAGQPSFDDRTTALSRSSRRLFEALGLWHELAGASAAVRHIHVSDRGRFGFAHIDAEQQGVEALGHVVVNRVLGTIMQERLAGAGNVSEYCPARIVSVAADDAGVRAGLEGLADGGPVLTARLLVVADGASSSVRELLGVGVRRKDYDQHAIIANLETELPIGDTAYERFTRDGPLALLPVPGGHAAFVRTVPGHRVEAFAAMNDAAFLADLQQMFGLRLGRFLRLGRRSTYPLLLSQALRITAKRSVLVGNAAHGLHPVAAQGFNLGLRDIATLCDCIAEALCDGGDIGAADLLARYADWRSNDQRKLVAFTDHLVGAFGSGRPWLGRLRNAGMLAFDLVPGVRGEFARHTMGLAGRLPRLSRGVPL